MRENGTEPKNVGPVMSLADVARELDAGYERLRGFADEAAVELGGMLGRGKGWKYPRESLEKFRQLLEAQEKGEVTPKTASAWLRNRAVPDAGANEIVPIAQPEGALAVRDLAQVLARLLPPPDDRLLSLKEARVQYGVSAQALKDMSMVEGGRRKVKKSAVLAYISRL